MAIQQMIFLFVVVILNKLTPEGGEELAKGKEVGCPHA
jgi:hypothetical protein